MNSHRLWSVLGSALLGITALASSGCRSLDRFDTGPGESYCGSMIPADFVRGGLLPADVQPSLLLRLTLDTDALDNTPGLISTDDGARGLCSPQPLFRDAPLRTISQVAHDELSLLEFGESREHNFLAWVDSSCTQTMLAIVSLMRDDSVEVRLLKPAPLAGAERPQDREPGFGIFRLRRQQGACQF